MACQVISFFGKCMLLPTAHNNPLGSPLFCQASHESNAKQCSLLFACLFLSFLFFSCLFFSCLINSEACCTCSCFRGTADHSSFIRDLWSSPEVTDIVSTVAGIPLELGYKYEIAHTNVQVSGAHVLHASWLCSFACCSCKQSYRGCYMSAFSHSQPLITMLRSCYYSWLSLQLRHDLISDI